MLTIEKLNKSFGNKKVLRDIELSLQEGFIYGMAGKNGAGKTTLFRCLTQLEHYEGKIHTTQDNFQKKLGYLPAEPYFFPKTTGAEYLAFCCHARGIKVPDLETKNIFGLPLHQYAENYSTGMKKKLALTGVLLQQNDFFILDEPFSGIDLESNLLFEQLLLELKKRGKTLLISSHLMTTLTEICDQIIVLEEGGLKKTYEKHEFEHIGKNFTSEETVRAIGELLS